MSLSQLQIFSKKRDATAALKGYEFQHLKTLKTWLENRINKIEELIYCDFEEDIFQRNLSDATIRFRQIKLYSTNFSFSSDAIQETLAHFFMLYTKGDYMFDTITFSCETNAAVAEKVVKGNDADVLQDWAAGWENLSEETKAKVRNRVRGILAGYIEKEYAARIRDSEVKPELQKARNVFNELTVELLDHFIGSIQWTFEGIGVNEAVENLRLEIYSLIERVPLPKIGSSEVAFSLLYREIVVRSMEDDPGNRSLSSGSMDLLLLRSGDSKEQWYAEVYAKWLPVRVIHEYQAGQFYEIIDASRYYRMNFHTSGHNGVWMFLLEWYINDAHTKVYIRRKAIYEFLFLALNPEATTGDQVGSLGGYEDKIRYYFEEWQQRKILADISEVITLLQIVQSQLLIQNINIGAEEEGAWKGNIHSYLTSRLETETRADEKCELLELMGDYWLHTSILKPKEDVATAIQYYREILPLLKHAQLYSINSLFETLEAIASVLVRFGREQASISLIEAFVEETQDAAAKAGQRHVVAKSLVARGVGYLEAGGLSNTLQALNCFHKAKALWYLERTMEGFILALLNISQVYYAVGMNIAGKYYALCAIWATWHSQDESIYNRIAQAMGLLFYGDFKQGAWITAMDDFELFMKSRDEYNPSGWAGDDDEMFKNTLPDIAFLIFASKEFAPEMAVYIDYRVSTWGDLWTVFIQPLIEPMGDLLEGRTVAEVARRHILGEPLADVGKVRAIAFNALDIEWNIDFLNTHTMNSIAEEFVSILEVYLCEIARVDKNSLRKDISVSIHIREGSGYDRILKHVTEDDWVAAIPVFAGKAQEEIRLHYARIAVMIKEIFLEYTPFSKEAFDGFWWGALHEKEKVGDKAFCVNPYQKVYNNVTDKNTYEKSQRAVFDKLLPHTVFTQLPKLLVDE